MFDVNRFSPGSHTLNITGVSEDGERDNFIIIFTVPLPPLSEYLFLVEFAKILLFSYLSDKALECTSSGVPGDLSVSCIASRTLRMPSRCSLSSRDFMRNFSCE